MNRNVKCRRSRGGFTLAETLVDIVLMSLVGMIVTGGISMGARVYGEITERANAELLLSTTLMRMRDELDRVEEVWTKDKKTYFRTSFSNWRQLVTSAEGEGDKEKFGVFIQEYGGYDITSAPKDKLGDPWPLVTEAMGGKDELYATFDELTYNNGNFEVKNLRVCKKQGETPDPTKDKELTRITEGETYKIRCLQKVTTH